MSPRKHTVDASKGVLEIDWPFFGELSRGLALKVARLQLSRQQLGELATQFHFGLDDSPEAA